MLGRTNLLVLILALALTAGVLTGPASPAPAPGKQPPGIRLDDPRIAALRNRLRSGALSVKREDLNKLIQPKSPLVPPKPPNHQDPKDVGSPKTQYLAAITVAQADKPAAKDEKPAPAASAQPQPSANNARAAQKPLPVHALITAPPAPGLSTGFHPVVRVQAQGRLDWTFVVSRQSLDPAPALQMAGYSSTAQTYQLYIPPERKPAQPLGMILHVSCGQQSDGWLYFLKDRRVAWSW